ncbi:MAG: pyruvate synthase [Candidatus Scalindua sp.]|jgi:pyruvate ferredoxin oxidoreductase beta subunit|nr:pyruvate synthase [Candidatus Scalindua sp.]MBT5305446.1 pyruvate synthase [Candidatus Scalindua sp.]MBT6051600.1 pyruvate synthase [Candidatus Scalindua sp.]MBT6227240.1 pyruvate synthase [Candidatus Scalindua sp.]MBT6563980.1 pyruvate synthase [Candidatus Scalindua sp.]
MPSKIYKKFKDISTYEHIASGTPLCSGCGGLLALRLAHKVLGKNVVIVNAAGCFTLLSVYPYSPFDSSWMYTAMACAPAGAQGIRDALDILIKKRKLSDEEDLKVVVLTGDGTANDIGLQSTSAAIHRGLDFYYFCYDNEAFSNTGFQMSSATPFGSKTSTSFPGKSNPGGTIQRKKDLFEIWRSHKPPYIATISPSHPIDLSNKFEKASGIKGPKLFITFSPCPPGWSFDSSKSVEIAKLAVQTGLWPLKEAVDGIVEHTVVPKFKPVEEYLKIQNRYDHLFDPVKQIDVVNIIQKDIDDYWKRYSDNGQ